MFHQNYKKVVEDLVQVVSSQEKELAENSSLMADLQKQLKDSGNFCCSFGKFFCTFVLADQYSTVISAMQMLPS
jgi:hypothetical protein